MKKFFQKQREIIIVFTYMGIIIVVVYFVIFPLILKIEGLNNQIQEESMKQEIIKQRLGDLPKIQQQYDALQKNEGSVNILLDKEKVVVLIEKLEKLAQDSNNKIEISLQDSQAQKNTPAVKSKTVVEDTLLNNLPGADYLQMQILLTGSYNNIINFISKVESMEYYSDIIGIKIKQSEPNTMSNSNFGSINPFNSNSTATSEEAPVESAEKNLEATLDVVFYTKK